MQIDPNAIGGFVGGIIAAGTIAWGVFTRARKQMADVKAEVAEAKRDVTVADSQGFIYKTLTDRLGTLERELSGLREELRKERDHSRFLEQKFYMLDLWIRSQGLTPPSFEVPASLVAAPTIVPAVPVVAR